MSFTQNWLPIVNPDPKNFLGLNAAGPSGHNEAAIRSGTFSGQILGLYAIAQTTFQGTETTFQLAQGPAIPIGMVYPRQSNIRPGVGPYMAALPARADWVNYTAVPQAPNVGVNTRNVTSGNIAVGSVIGNNNNESPNYRHHAEFVPISAVMPTYRWINTTHVQDLVITAGALIYGLQGTNNPNAANGNVFVPGQAFLPGAEPINAQNNIGLAANLTGANNPPSAPTVSTPASLTWDASVPFSNAPALQFFDFNWVNLFALSTPTVEPAMITVTSNPAGLAASVLAGAQPLLNTIVYNTVRITKLPGAPLATGAYAFVFAIYDKKGNAAVSATLNLTVT